MRPTLTLLALAALVGGGCSREAADKPSAREVVILDDTELEVSVWCNPDPPTPDVGVTETDQEVRLLVRAAYPPSCETAKNVRLQRPLGDRQIVDARTGSVLPVRADLRCAQAADAVGRCDDLPTPPPPTWPADD